MFRKELIEILHNNPMSVSQIARLVGESPGQVVLDLTHLFRSLKHTDYQAVVEPAKCRTCGFTFSDEKLKKPSKCPECHSTWVTEPRIAVEMRGSPKAEGRKAKETRISEAEDDAL